MNSFEGMVLSVGVLLSVAYIVFSCIMLCFALYKRSIDLIIYPAHLFFLLGVLSFSLLRLYLYPIKESVIINSINYFVAIGIFVAVYFLNLKLFTPKELKVAYTSTFRTIREVILALNIYTIIYSVLITSLVLVRIMGVVR